jgi:hypothetical protein
MCWRVCGGSGRTPMYEIPMMAVLWLVLEVVVKGRCWVGEGELWEEYHN